MNPLTVTHLALSLVLGGAFGVGVALLLWATPRWSAPSLSRRVAPYLRDIADPRGMTPLAGTGRLGWLEALSRLTARVGGGDAVAARLQRAGWRMSADGFRARQLGWGLAGLVAGAALVVVLVASGAATPASALVPPIAAAAGVAACDLRLSRAARARAHRAAEELPTVLEFLSLCLSAGEGAFDAIRRVATVGSGEVVAELRRAVVEVGTGASLTDALARVARRLDTPSVTRSIDQIVAAIDRGAPLAQVLQAQATDARDDAKRQLIEQAGRKEIYMLVPLVFLILPLSVLIAVFPGVVMLRLGLG
ncbi:type II secretion system F family protein [Microbacterium caowuchunii]|uniref:type II secretion system F family protein n=1 Tax=Microbacterium caowuchunii TaxID=2614638 RepID=UPI0012491A04|nr:type II secretion system F family protein [Microbacterium caowuchunii]QEV99690.1 type II secretion system F family protein [Microbacterium caowuchunii]